MLGSGAAAWPCAGSAGFRELLLEAVDRGGSRTGAVARGPSVAGAALEGRVEIMDGFLQDLSLATLAGIQL